MGAEITGSYVEQSGGKVRTLPILIPADANAIVTTSVSWLEADIITQLNFDNGGTVDFTRVYQQKAYRDSNNWNILEVHYMTDASPNWPGTGSKTLHYTIMESDWSPGLGPPNPAEDGPWFAAQCLRNINTADPIGDVESKVGTPNDWSASLPNATMDDLVWGAAGTYLSITSMAYAGQTELRRSNYFDNMLYNIGYALGATSFRINKTGGAGNMWSAGRGANVFKGAAAPTGMPIEINGNQAQDVKMNGASVAAIYLGSTQLWP